MAARSENPSGNTGFDLTAFGIRYPLLCNIRDGLCWHVTSNEFGIIGCFELLLKAIANDSSDLASMQQQQAARQSSVVHQRPVT
jgi:hypothetical protein